MGARRIKDGPFLAEQKAFGESPRLRLSTTGYLNSTIPCQTPSRNGRAHPRKSQITIRQLLNQTDGIESASRLQRATVRDRNAMAIQLPLLANPGTAFIYGPSHLQIFSELLRRKLRGRSVISYFEARVANRLGLRGLNFKKDARGNPLPATGFELTAHEWARLGELVIGRGNYHGRQIVPTNLLREAFAGSQVNPAYGLTFWLNEQSPNGREADMERMLDLPWQSAEWRNVVFLQGCACGHGRGGRLSLPASVYHPVIESDHCPARFGRDLFRRPVSTAGAWRIS